MNVFISKMFVLNSSQDTWSYGAIHVNFLTVKVDSCEIQCCNEEFSHIPMCMYNAVLS